MNSLAFFPWFQVGSCVSLADFRLVPYKRRRLPGGAMQPTLDLLLEPFLETVKPIRSATLVHHESRDLLAAVDETTANDLFQLRDIIACAGIANREYFGLGLRYCNRDAFILAIRDFDMANPAATVSRTFRRRDGAKHNIASRTTQSERRPGHVDSGLGVTFDHALAEALVRARQHLGEEKWLRIEDAMCFFNDANSDADQVREQTECVYLVSAFERLLDCRHGREKELVKAFLEVWQIPEPVPRETCARRLQSAAAGATLTEIWLRDFFRHRGGYAHGVLTARHSPVWTVRESLLLGSHVFPLLMKRVLASQAAYSWSRQDEQKAQLLEHLLAEADLFAQVDDPEEGPRWPWDRVRENQVWRMFRDPAK